MLPALILRHTPLRSHRRVEHCDRDGVSRVQLQGCSWSECGKLIAACADVCAAGYSPACQRCLQQAYLPCKDCFN